MSYDNFLGDQLLGSLGEPRIATGSSHLDFAARAHLSLVPDPIDLTAASTDEDQWQGVCTVRADRPGSILPRKGAVRPAKAKRICLGCEVRDSCLEYALANDERFGIWGGLSERERRRLKRGIV